MLVLWHNISSGSVPAYNMQQFNYVYTVKMHRLSSLASLLYWN